MSQYLLLGCMAGVNIGLAVLFVLMVTLLTQETPEYYYAPAREPVRYVKFPPPQRVQPMYMVPPPVQWIQPPTPVRPKPAWIYVGVR
jgi:hypothetical protein